MKTKTEALVLGLVRHSDSTDVATLYSRRQGRLSVAVPARSSKRHGGNPPLMPLSIIEGEISSRNGSELHKLYRFALLEPLSKMRCNPAKTAIGMFIAEFLGKLLREQSPDERLFDSIIQTLKRLDTEQNQQRVANFHIVFLWKLLTPAGITPDLSSYLADCNDAQWLDMRTGLYTTRRPDHNDIIAPRYATVPLTLGRLNFRNSHCLRLTGEQRYLLCEAMLHYYSVHLPGLDSLRSHHILRSIFS